MYDQPDWLLVEIEGRRVGYQISSASVSPVSMSETSFSAEDTFAWEDCGSNLVFIGNCDARFVLVDQPARKHHRQPPETKIIDREKA